MDLRSISYAMHAVAEVARAGENLLVSIDRSRRGWGAPILLGVALGVGVGALIFRQEARARVREWVGRTTTPARSVNGAARTPAPDATSRESDRSG